MTQDMKGISNRDILAYTFPSTNAHPHKMSQIYTNPSARSWKSPYTIDPAILTFHKTLPDYNQTPLLSLPQWFAEKYRVGKILLKDESHRFGLPAYKILGASWGCYRLVTKHLNLPPTSSIEDIHIATAQTDIRFYTATDGNWGRAVARMGTMLGARAHIYVPKVMVETTRAKIRHEGATVTVVDGDYDVAVKQAERDSTKTGGLLIEDTAWPGYEEIPQWVVDGYSTMMLEIDSQTQAQTGTPPSLIIVPIGVGSLGQATVAHFKRSIPTPKILTVEPDTAACLKTSLQNGQMTSISTENTAMCGMNCGTVSSTAWPILRKGVDASVMVTDAEAKSAMDLLMDMQIDVGPCAAATLAAFVKVCDEREESGFWVDADSVVVLLGTEGPRGGGA